MFLRFACLKVAVFIKKIRLTAKNSRVFRRRFRGARPLGGMR